MSSFCSAARASARALVAIATICGSGCSSLTPQIFSERLLVERGRDGKFGVMKDETPKTLEEAYADAGFVQRRYITAVHDQGNATPQLSAGLIGLSALTLYQGITGANARDLAAGGIVGTTAWLYGNTLLSKPRLEVYRAGAEAMMCAMAAVEPLRAGQQTLGRPTDDAGKATLYGRRAAVSHKLAALESLLRQHAALTRGDEVPVPAKPGPCKTVTQAAACPPIPAGTPKEEVELLQAQCRMLPPTRVQQCSAGQPAGWETRPAPPEVINAFNEARVQITGATQQLRSTARVIEIVNEAGPLLWKKSVEIQLAVSKEVDKTVPNLASILATVGGMRDVGFTLTGLNGFKSIGAAQGEGPQARRLSSDERRALDAIENATAELRAARVALDDLASLSLGIGRAELRKMLDDCSVKVSGIKLNVTPSGDSIPVPIGGNAVFFVSGGTGVPTGAVISGPRAAALPLKIEGGQFRFEFAPPSGVSVGDTFTLRFTDGGGAAEKLVEVVVTEAANAALNNGSAGASPAPSAAIAGGGTRASDGAAANALGGAKLADLTTDELRMLGLTGNATERDIQTAIDRCQASASPPIAKSRQFDSDTKRRLSSKPPGCNPRL